LRSLPSVESLGIPHPSPRCSGYVDHIHHLFPTGGDPLRPLFPSPLASCRWWQGAGALPPVVRLFLVFVASF
jgi:hypothetical protein